MTAKQAIQIVLPHLDDDQAFDVYAHIWRKDGTTQPMPSQIEEAAKEMGAPYSK